MLSQQDKFDLRSGSLRDGWEGALLAVRARKITAPTKCTMCELKSMCGMCPANGELENGDPEAPVDFLCRVAHMRAYALDLPVAPHGSCEFCEGGAERERLLATADRLTSGAGSGREPVAAPPPKPRSCSGGCSACAG